MNDHDGGGSRAHKTEAPLAPGELIEVAEGVYAWLQPDGTWWINNAGFVVGERMTCLVDTCTTERRTRELLDACAAVAKGRPLKFAVNTHHHGDHTFGNSLLPDGACLIGHPAMREGQLHDRTLTDFPPYWTPTPEFGDVHLRTPDMTVDGEASLYLGDRRVELHHPGYVAHTAGDIVAWVPDVRVLFVGDLLFPGHTPMILAGSPAGAIRALDWIASFDAKSVVPGHGDVVDSDVVDVVLDDHRRYYRFVLDEAARGLAADLTPIEVARTAELGEFGAWLDPERFVLNVHSAYAECAGGRADRAEAFRDVIDWLGSPVPTRV